VAFINQGGGGVVVAKGAEFILAGVVESVRF